MEKSIAFSAKKKKKHGKTKNPLSFAVNAKISIKVKAIGK